MSGDVERLLGKCLRIRFQVIGLGRVPADPEKRQVRVRYRDGTTGTLTVKELKELEGFGLEEGD